MKLVSLTAAAMMTANTAFAVDLSPTLALDNTVETWYNTDSQTWTSTYEIEATYNPSALPKVDFYAEMHELNLRDVKYTGVEFGMNYDLDAVSIVDTTLTAKVSYDDKWNRGDIAIGAAFKF